MPPSPFTLGPTAATWRTTTARMIPSSSPRTFTTSSLSSAAHFDTTHHVKNLERLGMTRPQAEGIVESLETIVQESVDNMKLNLVTRAEQNKHTYQQKVDFTTLRQTLDLSEKTDFTSLRASHESLLGDLQRLRQKLGEEITRTQAGVRLDLNLEKGRIRDEMSVREVRLTEVDTRIENEIGILRTGMEAVKFNVLQYAVATVSGSAALLLAYLRMFAH